MSRRRPRRLHVSPDVIERFAAAELAQLVHPRDVAMWRLSPASYLQRRKSGEVTAVLIWTGLAGAHLTAVARGLRLEAS